MRLVAGIAVFLFVSQPLAAQMEQHEHRERLGTVSFPISCNSEAQAGFTRAVALLHSFWYEEAEKAFTETARADPQCGMAWWGVAMSNYHQARPSPYSPAELARCSVRRQTSKTRWMRVPSLRGSILPAREMLGDLLLATNRPQPALEAFERSLKGSPARLNGLTGAANAAQMEGDREKARAYYLQVAKLLEAER